MKSSYYNHIFKDKNNGYVLFNSRTLATLGVSSEDFMDVKAIINNPNSSSHDRDLLSTLQYSGFIVENTKDEKKIIQEKFRKSQRSNDSCSITIAPTMGCNFNCYYCFESEEIRAKYIYMSDEVQDQLIEYIVRHFQKNNTKQLGICWFGGEPLLALNAIKRLSKKIITICQERNIIYEAAIITNGYKLNEKTAKILRECHIKTAQITIDGPEHIHDNRRILRGGAGSFKRIVKNLKQAVEHINVSIRINVDKQNKNHLDTLAVELEEFIDPDKININVAPVHLDPETNPKHQVALPETEYYERQKDFVHYYKDRGYQVVSAPELVSNACAADHMHSFMVGPEGEMYQCWEDFGNHELCIGHINDDVIHNEDYIDSYMSFDPTTHEKCSTCTVMPLCMGGCPKLRLMHKGTPQCGVYKFNLREQVMNNLDKKFDDRDYGPEKLSTQAKEIMMIEGLSEKFHNPTLNNFTYMLVPKEHNKDLYLRQCANVTLPMNSINIKFIRICKDLIADHKCMDLYHWAKHIKQKENLLSMKYIPGVIQYIEDHILNESMTQHLKNNHSSFIKNVLSMPDDVLNLFRINFHVSNDDVNILLRRIISLMNHSEYYRNIIERIEVAIQNDTVQQDYPTLIVYLKPEYFLYTPPNTDLLRIDFMPLLNQLKVHGHDTTFTHEICTGITLTQGYRLFKRYLYLIGLLDNLYDKSSNYAFREKVPMSV